MPESPILLYSAFALCSIFGVGGVFFLALRLVKQAEERYKKLIDISEADSASQIRRIKVEEKETYERKARELEDKLGNRESEIETRETEFLKKQELLELGAREIESKQVDLLEQEDALALNEHDVQKLTRLYRMRLYRLTGMTFAEAKDILFKEIERDSRDEINAKYKEMLNRSEAEIQTEAQRILIDVMQRFSVSPTQERGATLISIPNEEMKGRLIGKDGRNIKSFENTTGVTLMIDDTPGSVLISSFDPMRREIAKIALETLVNDGRIHPSSIEAEVEKAENDINRMVMEKGEDAVRQLNLTHVHSELVSLVGKLAFRLSNNQNTLTHSIEVAQLCGILASELGMDPIIGKRIGLFHDIGKSISHEIEGSHSKVASQLLKKHSEDPRVVNAVEASHGDVPDESVYAALLKVADSLSAARPGARADSMDGYIQRVQSLEAVAKNIEGVDEVFAIQAGRELRVIVSPEKTSDIEAEKIAIAIRNRVETELDYPDTIKLTIIREKRFVEIAR